MAGKDSLLLRFNPGTRKIAEALMVKLKSRSLNAAINQAIEIALACEVISQLPQYDIETPKTVEFDPSLVRTSITVPNIKVIVGKEKKKKRKATESQIPKILDNPKFHAVWADYRKMRSEQRHKALGPVAVKARFKEAAEYAEQYGLYETCQRIRDSIANGWQGIFFDKAPKNPMKTTVYDNDNALAL